jgi:hypothetical protein
VVLKTVKMNAIEIEPNTAGASNFTSSFFFKQPVDGTKYQVKWQQVLPSTGFKEQTENVVFEFPALDFPYSYEISDLLLSVKFQILKTDDTLPATTDLVVGINNMLHSLFKSVTLLLNGETVSATPEFYYYKAYLENLMTFDKNVKSSWLQSSGYGEDLPGVMWHSTNGSGYQTRALHFRKNLIESSQWSKDGKYSNY